MMSRRVLVLAILLGVVCPWHAADATTLAFDLETFQVGTLLEIEVIRPGGP
jgi:hypothetical protein